MQDADAVQERNCATNLPAAVAAFCAKKGELASSCPHGSQQRRPRPARASSPCQNRNGRHVGQPHPSRSPNSCWRQRTK
jgi:hypothetical protein